MNRHSKSSAVLASVMAMILAIPGGAWADGGRDGNNGHKNGAYNNHYNNHYNNNYNGYYNGKGYYYPKYYPCNNCSSNNNNHHDNHNNYKLWVGILGGGIAGYTLSNILQDQTASQGYYPPANTVPPAATVTRYESTYSGNTCLQQREYQTKITVGGKQVQGYGTACLQPDGSWHYGPAQAGSY
jgi:hypothetical protein